MFPLPLSVASRLSVSLSLSRSRCLQECETASVGLLGASTRPTLRYRSIAQNTSLPKTSLARLWPCEERSGRGVVIHGGDGITGHGATLARALSG